MRPIPIVFHLGPLPIHTYGIGLALTFVFGTWYLTKRFRDAGEPSEWLGNSAVWIIVGAILGARVVQVISDLPFYLSSPSEIIAIWHGGLSSFGGLLFAVPLGLCLARRHCPEVPASLALDLAAPVLAAGWALGRLLGPQLMIAGGGRATEAWYGMEYWGSVGRRVPVPIFQAIECFAVFLMVMALERWWPERPAGILAAAAAAAWGAFRFGDQYFWLGTPGQLDAVEVGGLILFLVGIASIVLLVIRAHRPRRSSVEAEHRIASIDLDRSLR
ncbi:MAG TPA: prolipoprotein diacylglyceryl transferase family protein [Actinomycetota bacterium]|nr:prolipoprotein diacylglyceryl transferase family protein [Actinomycetota bacterium]